MEFTEVVEYVVRGTEVVGVAVLVVGAVAALGAYLRRLTGSARTEAYEWLRRRLARVILLGLEILLLADIINTIVVDPTLDSVATLGVIVVIRIVLSFSLQVEMDGVWPWQRWRLDPGAGERRRAVDDAG